MARIIAATAPIAESSDHTCLVARPHAVRPFTTGAFIRSRPQNLARVLVINGDPAIREITMDHPGGNVVEYIKHRYHYKSIFSRIFRCHLLHSQPVLRGVTDAGSSRQTAVC
jgi:hypothetical protein